MQDEELEIEAISPTSSEELYIIEDETDKKRIYPSMLIRFIGREKRSVLVTTRNNKMMLGILIASDIETNVLLSDVKVMWRDRPVAGREGRSMPRINKEQFMKHVLIRGDNIITIIFDVGIKLLDYTREEREMAESESAERRKIDEGEIERIRNQFVRNQEVEERLKKIKEEDELVAKMEEIKMQQQQYKDVADAARAQAIRGIEAQKRATQASAQPAPTQAPAAQSGADQVQVTQAQVPQDQPQPVQAQATQAAPIQAAQLQGAPLQAAQTTQFQGAPAAPIQAVQFQGAPVAPIQAAPFQAAQATQFQGAPAAPIQTVQFQGAQAVPFQASQYPASQPQVAVQDPNLIAVQQMPVYVHQYQTYDPQGQGYVLQGVGYDPYAAQGQQYDPQAPQFVPQNQVYVAQPPLYPVHSQAVEQNQDAGPQELVSYTTSGELHVYGHQQQAVVQPTVAFQQPIPIQIAHPLPVQVPVHQLQGSVMEQNQQVYQQLIPIQQSASMLANYPMPAEIVEIVTPQTFPPVPAPAFTHPPGPPPQK